MKVLLVDDDPTTLAILRRRLELRGHVVESRSEVIGTSRAIRAFRPDAVVLDVGMPAMQGDQLARLIARDGSTAKVVLLSDRPDDELAKLAQECGASAHLAKRNAEQLADLLEQIKPA